MTINHLIQHQQKWPLNQIPYRKTRWHSASLSIHWCCLNSTYERGGRLAEWWCLTFFCCSQEVVDGHARASLQVVTPTQIFSLLAENLKLLPQILSRKGRNVYLRIRYNYIKYLNVVCVMYSLWCNTSVTAIRLSVISKWCCLRQKIWYPKIFLLLFNKQLLVCF